MNGAIKFGALLCALSVLFSSAAFAAEPSSEAPVVTELPDVSQAVPVPVPEREDVHLYVVPAPAPAPAVDVPPSEPSNSPVVPVFNASALDELPPSDSADPAGIVKLPAIINDLFGPYTPRTRTVTTTMSDGTSVTSTEVVPGLAGLDWPWIVSAGLFALLVYCVLRMIGGLVKWN